MKQSIRKPVLLIVIACVDTELMFIISHNINFEVELCSIFLVKGNMTVTLIFVNCLLNVKKDFVFAFLKMRGFGLGCVGYCFIYVFVQRKSVSYGEVPHAWKYTMPTTRYHSTCIGYAFTRCAQSNFVAIIYLFIFDERTTPQLGH